MALVFLGGGGLINLRPAPHLCLEIFLSSSRTGHFGEVPAASGSTSCHLVMATGLKQVKKGAETDQRGLSGPWSRVHPGFRGGWAAEVTAPPALPASHSCFLPGLPTGTPPSRVPPGQVWTRSSG